MKYVVPLCLILLIAFGSAGAGFAQVTQSNKGREILNNESIVSLTKAGFKESTIITLIRSSDTAFDISTEKLVDLKKRGVKEKIITEMIERTSSGEAIRRLTGLRNDEFFAKDDDAFFNGSQVFKELPSEKDAKRKEDEAMIFGSQSGSRSKSQTNSNLGPGKGERDKQTELTGSATVKLIRPSGESGAAPKLERAPKLDNQGILEMIQAGFSEGTVIRKIESSQVDFDLSQKALVSLRQNRVSDRIIKAMTTAMDESK